MAEDNQADTETLELSTIETPQQRAKRIEGYKAEIAAYEKDRQDAAMSTANDMAGQIDAMVALASWAKIKEKSAELRTTFEDYDLAISLFNRLDQVMSEIETAGATLREQVRARILAS